MKSEIRRDPEGIETAVLLEIADLAGKRVLEIGSGEGRLTWRYAAHTASVLGIDPDPESVEAAREATPSELADKVEFRLSSVDEYELGEGEQNYEIAILAWSL